MILVVLNFIVLVVVDEVKEEVEWDLLNLLLEIEDRGVLKDSMKIMEGY